MQTAFRVPLDHPSDADSPLQENKILVLATKRVKTSYSYWQLQTEFSTTLWQRPKSEFIRSNMNLKTNRWRLG